MKIELIESAGIVPALFGIGLSHGLTSGKKTDDIHPFAEPRDENLWDRLTHVATKLAPKDGGHNKFLRQIVFWWDATFPRFLWQEVDQYRIGVTTQSESTMHTIAKRNLTYGDFEEPISPSLLNYLNDVIKKYNETNDLGLFMWLKNILPEGFLQRRIWSLSLANMKNIHAQRKSHRLPQWQTICSSFVEATPEFLRGVYSD